MTEQQTFDQEFTDMLIDHTGDANSTKENTLWPPEGLYSIEFGELDEDKDSPTYGLNKIHGFAKVPYEILEADKNVGPGPYEHLFWMKTEQNKGFTRDLLARLNNLPFIEFGATVSGATMLQWIRDLNGRRLLLERTSYRDKKNVIRARDKFFHDEEEYEEATSPKQIGGDPEPSSDDITAALDS